MVPARRRGAALVNKERVLGRFGRALSVFVNERSFSSCVRFFYTRLVQTRAVLVGLVYRRCMCGPGHNRHYSIPRYRAVLYTLHILLHFEVAVIDIMPLLPHALAHTCYLTSAAAAFCLPGNPRYGYGPHARAALISDAYAAK